MTIIYKPVYVSEWKTSEEKATAIAQRVINTRGLDNNHLIKIEELSYGVPDPSTHYKSIVYRIGTSP